ncbi:MAG: hypothetical protein AAGI34_04650, partial [Pseudomonadota bacterium]
SVAIKAPAYGVNSTTISDPETGISITITGDFNLREMRDETRMDVLWGVKLIDPRLSHKILTKVALAA